MIVNKLKIMLTICDNWLTLSFLFAILKAFSETGYVKDIKNIVCINGPGSFTGLRIGLTVGKTLAYTLNVSIYLMSSLEAYLVSSEKSDNNIAVIEDTKGYYIRGNNIEEQYVTDMSKYEKYNIVPKVLDVRKVVSEALKKNSVNAHLVRANYVKEIEVNKRD